MRTRIQFIDAVLADLRVKNERGNTLAFLTLSVNEYGSRTDGAKFNPFDTTLKMPGSTDFNSVGVQNFVSFDQGVQASVLTLTEGTRYATALRRLHGPIVDAVAHAEGVLNDLMVEGWGSINLSLVKQVEKDFNFYAELKIPGS